MLENWSSPQGVEGEYGIVPVPKKPRTGPCIPDDFRGIALTSVVYKAMCTVIRSEW